MCEQQCKAWENSNYYSKTFWRSLILLSFKIIIWIVNSGFNSKLIDTSAAVCSHRMAMEYFLESINGAEFISTQCNTYRDFKLGLCNNNFKTRMGLPVSTLWVQYHEIKNKIFDFLLTTLLFHYKSHREFLPWHLCWKVIRTESNGFWCAKN